MPDLSPLAAAIVTAGAVLAVLGGWWRWLGPMWRDLRRDFRASRDALIGRDALVDSITGREIAPALPGMGVRMDLQETITKHQSEQMAVLTDAVARLADQSAAIDDHEHRIKMLEEAHAERLLNKVEQAAAFRAMEQAIKATPDLESTAVDEDPAED